MQSSILLIASDAVSVAVAETLEQELGARVELAAQPKAALRMLREGWCELVLMEEGVAAADPSAADLIYANAGFAPVLEINFAITGTERIVRQTRAALARRQHDQAKARAAAAASLQSELNASLTGLLLESELALRNAAPEQAPKLRHLVQLAGDLRDRLRA